jgi:hypothetical protein
LYEVLGTMYKVGNTKYLPAAGLPTVGRQAKYDIQTNVECRTPDDE